MSSGKTPVFTSDKIDQLEGALLRVYGQREKPEYQGRGRPPKPRLIPPKDLVYVQLIKERGKGNRVVKTHKRIVFGEEELGKANTSYVERNNLTVRQSIARFVRKTLSFSKRRKQHRNHLKLYKAWYNLVKTHSSLKVKSNRPGRKWEYRTPAMAAGITDHIWTMKELMTYRVTRRMKQ
nr:IS1 family transposase [Candidatus Freyarchaeota archaeon]